MKVLILHQHFRTPQQGGAIRSYYLARALVERGVIVSVIVGSNGPSARRENIDGIDVEYIPVSYANKYGFYRRIFSFGAFVVGALMRAARHRDADLCYAISTPLTVGLAAIAIKKRYKIPYYFEVGDLWPDAPIQLGFVRNPALQKLMYRIEKMIYEGAQTVVALSPSIQESITKKTSSRIALIPNMADTEFFLPSTKNPTLEKRFGVENKFVITYAGAMGKANGLDHILSYASICNKKKLKVHFVLCGDGAMREPLMRRWREMRLKNVTFLSFRNREGVREVLNVSDACLIAYRSSAILETGSPNKYFDALAAGKMIIINFGGWIKSEIEREQCGFAFNALDPEDFVAKVTPFLNDVNQLSRYQVSSRALAESKYSREVLGEEFFRIISSVKEVDHTGQKF